MQQHPVFHVSLLKPFVEDTEDPGRGVSDRAPPTIRQQFTDQVEEVLAVRTKNRKKEYLVRWSERSDADTSWETIEDLWQFKQNIEEFETPETSLT